MTSKALFPQPVKPELLLSITSVALTRKRHRKEGFPRITNHKSPATSHLHRHRMQPRRPIRPFPRTRRRLQFPFGIGGAHLNVVFSMRRIHPDVAPERPDLRRHGVAENLAGIPSVSAIGRNLNLGDAHFIRYGPTGNDEVFP